MNLATLYNFETKEKKTFENSISVPVKDSGKIHIYYDSNENGYFIKNNSNQRVCLVKQKPTSVAYSFVLDKPLELTDTQRIEIGNVPFEFKKLGLIGKIFKNTNLI